MDNITIQTFQDGTGPLVLTTQSPASHYGIPVLRHEGCSCPDMGPADQIPRCVYPQNVVDLFGELTAAEMVTRAAGKLPHRMLTDTWDPQQKRWVHQDSDPAAAEREGMRQFCTQWPEGPQI